MSKENMYKSEYEKVPRYEGAFECTAMDSQPPQKFGFGVRHIQILLLFSSLSIGFVTRGHLGMTIVAMTDVSNENGNKSIADNDTVAGIFNNNSYIIDSSTTEYNVMYTESYDNENVTTVMSDKGFLANLDGTEIDDDYFEYDYYELSTTESDIGNKARYEFASTTSFSTVETTATDNANFITTTAATEINMEEETLKKESVYQVYDWPKSKQEMVLSSFYIGYSVMMFPMGLICQKFGGKLPLQVALLVNGVISVFTPWLAMLGGWMAVCACRLVQGLTQAAFYPSMHTMLARWVPLSERGRLTTYVYTGTTFGTVVGFQISGLLADSAWGWPSTFWVTGVFNIVTLVLLTYFGAATPQDHPTISETEKMFIMGQNYGHQEQKHRTPWLSIIRSKHVWALYSTQVGSAVGFIFLLVQMPTYMFHILQVDIKKSGIYSSLPYIAMYVTGLLFGYMSDFCTNRQILSIRNARRLSNSIAMVGPAVFMTACSYTEHTGWAVALLVMSMGSHAGVHTGWMVNHIDLAPNFSGAMMALGNTLGNVFGLGLPLLVSNVVTDVKDQSQWRILFILISVISLVSNAVFVMFMSSETQQWNSSGKKQSDEVETTKQTPS